jgi:hypothetical protein
MDIPSSQIIDLPDQSVQSAFETAIMNAASIYCSFLKKRTHFDFVFSLKWTLHLTFIFIGVCADTPFRSLHCPMPSRSQSRRDQMFQEITFLSKQARHVHGHCWITRFTISIDRSRLIPKSRPSTHHTLIVLLELTSRGENFSHLSICIHLWWSMLDNLASRYPRSDHTTLYRPPTQRIEIGDTIIPMSRRYFLIPHQCLLTKHSPILSSSTSTAWPRLGPTRSIQMFNSPHIHSLTKAQRYTYLSTIAMHVMCSTPYNMFSCNARRHHHQWSMLDRLASRYPRTDLTNSMCTHSDPAQIQTISNPEARHWLLKIANIDKVRNLHLPDYWLLTKHSLTFADCI